MAAARADWPAEDAESSAPGFDDSELKLGDIMRGERATLGRSLLDVQRDLRIRAAYVAAIENCDLSAFESPSLVAGLVRSYARYLGMDPEATFRRFCRESGFQPTHGMAPDAAPKPQRRPSDPGEALANPRALFIPQPEPFWSAIEPRAIGSLAVLLVLVAGLGYGGYSVLREVQKVNLTPVDQAPGVITALDPVADGTATGGEDRGLAEMDLPKPDALDRLYRPQTLDVPVVTARDTPIAAIDPQDAVPAKDAVAQALAESLASLPAGVVPAPGAGIGPQLPVADAGAVRTVAPDAQQVEILAARPAWVRVTSADGTVILEKTMDAGERFTLPKLEAAPVLRTGNSGAIYFAVSGRTYGPAAPGPQVVKNVELSPAALTAKFAAADLTQDPELAQMVNVASVAAPAGETPATLP